LIENLRAVSFFKPIENHGNTIEEQQVEDRHEEVLEERVHKEIFREEGSDEVQHVENTDETSSSILLLDEDEVVQPCFPPTHEDEEVISSNDIDDFMEELSDMVGQHIEDFIHVGRHGWDMDCFIFLWRSHLRH